MSLQYEIDQNRKSIKADGYPMSIGEIASMYREGDLDIHPAFQRFFRWDKQQKSKWIESLLLGIPTPSFFVAQREDGVWDVVDGLQRLSTIFEFMGILRNQDGSTAPPLILEGTDFLPSLEGKVWEHGTNSLTDDQRRFLKREKLDIKIVLRESDESSKFELFQRLNTGGSALSDQELRNCMLVSTDPEFFEWLDSLSSSSSFQNTIPLPERLVAERFDLELALRFVLFRSMAEDEFRSVRSLGDFITRKMLLAVKDRTIDREREQAVFERVFSRLSETMGDDAFKKFDRVANRFKGPFLVSAFEVIALGLASDRAAGDYFDPDFDLRGFVESRVWSGGDSVVTRSGESAVNRLPRTLEQGRGLFEVAP